MNVTVPAESPVRKVELKTSPATATSMPSTSLSPNQQVAAETNVNPIVQGLRYAAAMLKGQPDMIESVAPCFVSKDARIKKLEEEGWVLELTDLACCTKVDEFFPIADEKASHVNCILSLYCGATSTISVDEIYWIASDGKRWRSMRGPAVVNIVSSKGLAELGTGDTGPLGSAVFQAMTTDLAVKEALTLHGEGELGWSQIYDIIEFIGGVVYIAKAGYASQDATRRMRRAANHHRHLGSPKNAPLPLYPPTLEEATEFARNLLKQWIASRLK